MSKRLLASALVPMSAPDITEDDVQAVANVVRSGRLALGDKSIEFEHLVAAYVGRKYGVAVSSGTAALHLAVRALGIGPGDEVLVPSFTFAATVNSILYQQGTPVFVDIEPDTFNLSPADLAKRVTRHTKAIMTVDVFGQPVDWADVMPIAADNRLAIIDDACEALGAAYRGTKVGKFGDIATFAFYPNKQLTTGEGGMLVTDDPDVAALTRSLRNQGRTKQDAWLEHERLGFNYRMDEMSAALGVSQFGRLEEFLEERQRVAELYTERLGAIPEVRVPVSREGASVSWFVYVILLSAHIDRDSIMVAMQDRGIAVRGYFSPIHLQPYVRKRFNTTEGQLPVTEAVSRRTLALPFHNNMTQSEVDRVVETLKLVLG